MASFTQTAATPPSMTQSIWDRLGGMINDGAQSVGSALQGVGSRSTLFGTPPVDPNLKTLMGDSMDPQYLQGLQRRNFMRNMGISLLSQGPTQYKQGMFTPIAQGIAAGAAGEDKTQQEYFKMAMAAHQKQLNDQFAATAPPELQALAKAYPEQYAGVVAAKATNAARMQYLMNSHDPATLKLYNAAVAQGTFTGTLEDWMAAHPTSGVGGGANTSPYGLQPVYSVNTKTGAMTLHQLRNDQPPPELGPDERWAPGVTQVDTGTASVPVDKRSGLPIAPPIPKDIVGKSYQEGIGTAQAKRDAEKGPAKAQLDSAMQPLDILTDSINRALSDPGFNVNFGLQGKFPNWPGSKASNAWADISSIQAGQIMAQMHELKRLSPSGSTGFGSLVGKEEDIMQNAIIALQSTTSADFARIQLKILKDSLDKTRQFVQESFDRTYNEPIQSSGATSSTSVDAIPDAVATKYGLDQAAWDHATPEEKATLNKGASQ